MRLASLPLSFVSQGFSRDGAPTPFFLLLVIAGGLLQAALVAGGTYLDRTWYLPGVGKGLMEHYGVWAILVTNPLILVATALVFSRYKIAVTSLPVIGDAPTVVVVARRNEKISSSLLRGTLRFAFFLMVVVGFLSWLNNLYQTSDPRLFYGNDVFDSPPYLFGYLANKFILLTSWAIIYPIAGTVLFGVSISIRQIVSEGRQQGWLVLSAVHPDNAFGLHELANLNAAIVGSSLLVYVVFFALLLTHESIYASLLIPLVVATALFLAATLFLVFPVLQLARQARRTAVERLTSTRPLGGGSGNFEKSEFALERICLGLTQSPYSKTAGFVLVTARVVPVLGLLLRAAHEYGMRVWQ